MAIDRQTINKLYTHNQDAFCEVYEVYHNLVYYVIFSRVKDKEVTKELVQDTFIRMWNNINSFDQNTNFQAWLLKIAKNLTIDYIRSHKQIELHEEIDVCYNDVNSKILFEFNTDVNGVLSELEYNVIVLTAVYNLKRREVAKQLEKPLGTILRVYQEAVVKLKKLYEIEESNIINKQK